MEIEFEGANCVTLSGKKFRIVIDDNLSEVGLRSVTKTGDIALFTHDHAVVKADVKLVIDTPGEYEVSDVSIKGISARAHMDEDGKKTATIYRLVIEDIRVVVVGHIYPDLSDQQLESIGTIDILIVPVGGNGYTLDPIGAQKIIKKLEPKLIIPTHYEDKDINYEVPQQPLEEALKLFALEVKEPLDKLKIKSGEISETVQIAVITR